MRAYCYSAASISRSFFSIEYLDPGFEMIPAPSVVTEAIAIHSALGLGGH